MRQRDYDYIIAGAGCAGLSLAVHLIKSGKFAEKKILITDQSSKRENDRTWCFWETESGIFEDIVFRQWGQLQVRDANGTIPLDLKSYQYKLIRGIDFYNYSLALIAKQPNFTFLKGKTEQVFNGGSPGITVNGETFTAQYIFNSILKKPTLRSGNVFMLQHFRGWRITTSTPVFDPAKATLMDFRTPQNGVTAFLYVLPFSEAEALIEYTVFSTSVLAEADYENALQQYILKFISSDYVIAEREAGVIPMTNADFPTYENSLFYIGTAGGQTKGSTGYTFQFIQKQSAEIVDLLKLGKKPKSKKQPWRFRFYDSVLLDVLSNNSVPGAAVFIRLFEKSNCRDVFRFLDNETTLPTELRIISRLPFAPFAKAALRRLLG
ncbi:MAG TPA: lycopene cyclase family protein [Flavobacterium sp.]|jgi:lycopene beta-cyclase